MKNKVGSYLLSGAILIYYGLKDLDNFYIFYEGIALAIGITALVMAGLEYKKKLDQERTDKHE